MKAALAGAGPLAAFRPGARGAVLASFSRACYVDLPAGLVALVGPGVHPGPLHLVLDYAVPRVPAGTPVTVEEGAPLRRGNPGDWPLRATRLRVGEYDVDLCGLRPWMGVLPAPPVVRASAPLVQRALTEVSSASALWRMGARTHDGLERLAQGNLEAAASFLSGIGPGLTPAGDDALAGAMFAIRAAWGPAAEPMLCRTAGPLAAGRISSAFLAWALRGQALAPVHDLFAAASRDDEERAAAAVWALASVGATSGADFAAGLCCALTDAAIRRAAAIVT